MENAGRTFFGFIFGIGHSRKTALLNFVQLQQTAVLLKLNHSVFKAFHNHLAKIKKDLI